MDIESLYSSLGLPVAPLTSSPNTLDNHKGELFDSFLVTFGDGLVGFKALNLLNIC